MPTTDTIIDKDAPPAAPAWPTDLVEAQARYVLDQATRFRTTEYVSLTRAGAPITWPVTPYAGSSGGRGVAGRNDAGAPPATIDVSTGITYPLKAERARRDPRVALSFSDPTGSGLERAPIVLVQGLATVRDADLQATSARYLDHVRSSMADHGTVMPEWALRRMAWYWTRMWVQITPLRVTWWPEGRLDREPRRWSAPCDTSAPASDPAPPGRPHGSGAPAAADWRRRTDGAIERLGLPVLSTVDRDGWPLVVKARRARATPDGFVVTPPRGVEPGIGPASLTFHHHAPGFEHQENIGLTGTAERQDDGNLRVRVERALGDIGIPRGALRSALHFERLRRRLAPRLAEEARRRGRLPTWEQIQSR